MAGKARAGIALHWTEFLCSFSLHFQAILISFLTVSVHQLTFGSAYPSKVQIFKSSCRLFWYLFAHQSHGPVHSFASAEKEKVVSEAFMVPWAQLGFQVPSKTSAFTKAPGPCHCCLGGLGGPDPAVLASSWLLAYGAAALEEGLMLALFLQPPAVWDYPCYV